MTKFYKLVFSSTLISGTVLAISSMSWFSAWMGLEINLLSLMPLMKNFKNKFASEATIKYFITQAMASMIMLLSILMFSNTKNLSMEMAPSLLLSASLLMKMGAAPLHFWLPEVVSGVSWGTCLLILTWQKIAPMILLFYSNTVNSLMYATIIVSSMVGGLLGLNQICLRKIMAFSSINHISWMLAASITSMTLWMTYFVVYSLINTGIILTMHKNKMFYLPQLMKLSPSKKYTKMVLLMSLLSLGGLPPFLGFLPKWLTISALSSVNLMYLATVLIITTLLSLFIYLRITFTTLTLSSDESLHLKTEIITMSMNMLSMVSMMGLMLTIVMSEL
uniref:NADH-ubiquinone oxidoreductase chain 2 n=1 Tax=Gnathotrichus materiarius TaxID=1220286 RepID=A0A343A6M3_9CUCU|nr:NADH dehydrogenase subunit 2 [Gnathotrichus materiarius]AOY40228.1 NADH dehydrogenase subunit 2 [Gnathotrichus materiarius]